MMVYAHIINCISAFTLIINKRKKNNILGIWDEPQFAILIHVWRAEINKIGQLDKQ